jgi:hypothetical protein
MIWQPEDAAKKKFDMEIKVPLSGDSAGYALHHG